MKPFNLEAAKRGEPYVYMATNKALTFLGTIRRNDGTVKIVSKADYGTEELLTHDIPANLFMLSRKEKRWIVSWIYSPQLNSYCEVFYNEQKCNQRVSDLRATGRTNVAITEIEV